MDFGIAIVAALIGYLLGSISFARILTRAVAPGTDISKIEEPMPDSDYVFTSDSVSATAVRIHVLRNVSKLKGLQISRSVRIHQTLQNDRWTFACVSNPVALSNRCVQCTTWYFPSRRGEVPVSSISRPAVSCDSPWQTISP